MSAGFAPSRPWSPAEPADPEIAARRFVVPAAHPSLAGHFPGRPILPGVVLLDEVLAAARGAFGFKRVDAIPAVKFQSPVAPGGVIEIQLERLGARVRFRCLDEDGRPVAEGHLMATGEA